MHYTDYILDKTHVPISKINIDVFKEMQTLLYDVFKDYLKTEKVKSLVSQFVKSTLHAQSIYQELKKKAMSSKAAQLSGDKLLHNIEPTRFHGNWIGKRSDFVLHWKEQVLKYKTLEIKAILTKEKLQWLHNAVCDIPELSYVKRIEDQDIARCNLLLEFDC
jgi:hypothetical protein